MENKMDEYKNNKKSVRCEILDNNNNKIGTVKGLVPLGTTDIEVLSEVSEFVELLGITLFGENLLVAIVE